MARLSISRVLETRNKIRIITALASFLLMVMLLQGFVLNNPKKSRAIDVSGDAMVLAGDFFIGVDGAVYESNAGLIKTEYKIDNYKVVLGGANPVAPVTSNLVFAGGQRTLKDFKIRSGSTVSHIGPNGYDNNDASTKNILYLEDIMIPSYRNSGLIIEGQIRTYTGKVAIDTHYNNNNLKLKINSNTYDYETGGSMDGAVWADGLNAGQYYDFKLYSTKLNEGDYIRFWDVSTATSGRTYSTNNIRSDQGDEKFYVTYYSNAAYNQQSFEECLLSDENLKQCFNYKTLVSPKLSQNVVNVTVGGRQGYSLPGFSYVPSVNIGTEIKLDLNIAGDFTVEDGGKIDVAGKGYLGGRENGEDGFGPGGGSGGDGDNGAGGGGHGGRGGLSEGINVTDYPDPIGPKTTRTISSGGYSNDAHTNPSDHGSGGGASGDNNGGSGGGVVKISAKNITLGGLGAIDASGITITASTSRSGGGAGGTVNLKATSTFSMSLGSNVIQARGGRGGGDYGGDGGGGRVAIVTNQLSGGITEDKILEGADSGNTEPSNDLRILPTINVFEAELLGGASVVEDLTLAERGTIYFSNGSVSNNVMKKLIPISRVGANPENNFNPYALKVGDVIKVDITVSNLVTGQQIIIKDDFLRTNGTNNMICRSNGVIGGVGEVASTDTSISWTYTPTEGLPIMETFYYQCKVEQE